MTCGFAATDRGNFAEPGARTLDANDLGPHVGQHHPAEWTGTETCQFDYFRAM